MKENFSELVEYLDQKFEKTATKTDVRQLGTEIVGVKENIKELTIRMERVEESIHALTTTIDKLAKAVDDLRVEYSAIAMQMNRHEKWIQQIAEKLGMKLEHD